MINKHADPEEFVKVYNALMHVHQDLTFKSGLSIEQREEHLQIAMGYNGNSIEMAQKLPSESGALAEGEFSFEQNVEGM
jgi:hypothetical protein